MRGWLVSIGVLAACGAPPPRPTAAGTLICVPETPMLGANAALPDDRAATRALEARVVADVTDAAFLHRVAAAERIDEAQLARGVVARPRADSRLVEIGVALPDRALALRACNAILDHYTAERLDRGADALARPAHDVRILDRCAPR